MVWVLFVLGCCQLPDEKKKEETGLEIESGLVFFSLLPDMQHPEEGDERCDNR